MTTPTKRDSPTVVVFAPIGRDGPASAELLNRSGMEAVVCHSLEEVLQRAETEADAVFIAEEGLFGHDLAALAAWVDRQPAWSDFPFVVLTSKHQQPAVAAWRQRMVAALRNVSLLERPVQSITLTSAMKAALRGRHRQYEVRALLEARERASHELEALVVERTSELEKANQELRTQMAERTRIEETLRQAQKIEAIGQLTGGIAHDFNNLLTGIITGIELMKQRIIEGRADSVLRFADAALSSARSAASLTNRLLAFARKQPLDARALDINERIRSLEDLLRRTIGERITLSVDFTEGPAVARVDVSQFESALLNLVINARDALPEGGHIGIRTFSTDASQHPELAAGRYIGLCVSDDGTGIDPAVLDKVFDPFFTTKPQGRGTGLGLSSIYGFALQSGGDAHIRSTLGVGTDVTLLLPAADGETSLVPSAASEDSARLAGHEHVLVVEDMPSVRMLIAETLIEAGYRCSQAGDVETAQALLEADPSIDLLLTDVGLPRLSGRQLAEWARRSRPALPVVLMTGYAEKASSREGFVDERMELVLKPFEGADLLGKIRALLDNG